MAEELNKNVMTQESYDKLEKELKELKEVARPAIAQKIKEAREQGDLSENAEYDAAKDEQRDIEAHITKLEETLRNASIVEVSDGSTISLGCTVEVIDLDTDDVETWQIVASNEVDSLEGKISTQSPVGAALEKKQVGDIVKIETHAGTIRYQVKSITIS